MTSFKITGKVTRAMEIYRHYSFDLWLTLIKSNPLFKKQRCRIFHQQYNALNKPLDEVEFIFRQVDLMCNNINEATGKNIDAEEMYLMVISQLNDNKAGLHDIDIHALYLQMETLLFEFMPLIYSPDTPEILAHIKENPDCTTNILSNTGFIKGVTLRKVLKTLNIEPYFDFQLYSDEAGLSKPNTAFFRLLLDQVAAFRSIPANQIVHIGDNIRADIWGAEMAGIQGFQVNSNNIPLVKLIPDATQHLFFA
ncbi:putative hydrolase of the HAD superfamily [Mucilaginibacter gotjawali]|uniref:Hydrolase of the HAD superfamily n=1 Tax=Mucilaginibacter gotjawali TaxID=1550579 RepID=A0A839SFS1_9SPHI|nr:putative hydrolase of the HAD superfamily [Mucilaginibacter gotjawali]